MIKNFILTTRGRTGSTAIIDELDRCHSIVALDEIFRKISANETDDALNKKFPLMLPFDSWKDRSNHWQKFLAYFNKGEVYFARKYLLRLEELALKQKETKAFGWKVLSHHFDQRPYLFDLLRELGYERSIYLRRNVASQVLSGMIAVQRGKYNSKENFVDNRTYSIDIEKFIWHINFERQCIDDDCKRLKAQGMMNIVVNYEDYCNDREVFHKEIFKWLDIPVEIPPPTDYVKMIENPETVISNYAQVVAAAKKLGDSF